MKIRTKAFTLIELLVGISIAGILIVISFPAIKTLSQVQKQLHTRQEATIAIDGAHKEIALALSRAQTLTFLDSVLLEQSENISRHNKFVYYLRNHPPKAGSSIISFIHPLPEYGGEILYSSSKTVTYCFPQEISEFSYDLSDFTWLLVGLSAQSYNGGKAHIISSLACPSKKAVSISLQTLPIDLFSSPLSPTSKDIFLAAVPIEHSYSIYLDSKNILRKLYHKSGQNQPLIKDINTLLIEDTAIGSHIKRLDIQINSARNVDLEEAISRRIYLLATHRLELLDFLL
ncbi:MAG: type II secretion system protein [Deltaproteobacteria bacterium]|nr:type II secretion system protein [Deltaproteobacteria bacterium]